MLHSGLSKSQPLPLLAGASSPRRALLAGLLRAGYFSKSATSSPALRPSATRASTRAATTPRDPSRFGLGHRVSFSTAPDGSDSEGGIGGEENEPIDNPKWGRIKDKFRRNVARDEGSRDRGERFENPDVRRWNKQEDRGERFDKPDVRRWNKQEDRGERFDKPDVRRWSKQEDRGERFDKPDVRRWNKQEDRGERFRGERFNQPDVRRWNKQEDWGRKTWKEVGESTVPKMVGEGVYGVGPVLAALTAGRREFYALYTQEGMDLSRSNKKKKDKRGIEKVLLMAETIGLKVIEASKHDLNMVVDNRPHQGLVLDASPLEMVNTKELERVRVRGGKAPVWIALDEVMDPQNLGAIIRSAYFFGAEGVVLCAKNSAPLSGVFLSSSAENGWRVLGGTVAPKAIPLSEVTTGEPTILVLGSEGTGLRPLVERSCTHLVKIAGNADGFVVEEEIDATDADIGEEGDNYSVENHKISIDRKVDINQSSSLQLPPGILKQLERIQRQCHRRENCLDPKPSLAAWELVCRPKSKGGLILNPRIQSEALLLKHVNKFYNKLDIPWVQLIGILTIMITCPFVQDMSDIAMQAKRGFGQPFFSEVVFLAWWNIWLIPNAKIFDNERPTFVKWRSGFIHDISLLAHRIKVKHRDMLLRWISFLPP
ncbi:Mitochondrial rRNA methyltransferase [Triticum urartu]|uniref:rRNA methyltransferase 1, mitochondrial n=1 Tax=Triticum urartu TaxID=4572 RepID=M7ZHJ1_TRIUA|nr:Mitochondrial rRNA methyltransferase [Triticum urartu]